MDGSFFKRVFSALFVLLIAACMPAAAEAYFKSEKVFEFDENRPQNHASTIAEMPNGDLLVTWFGGTSEGLGDVALWICRKSAQTGEWSKPERLVDNPELAEGNSVLFTDSKGKVWLFYVLKYAEKWDAWDQCNVFLKTSEDSGMTWTEPRKLTDKLGWMIRNNIIELEGGTLVLPTYIEEPIHSYIWTSNDGFETREEYSVPVTEPGNSQPSIVYLNNGKFLVFGRYHGVPGKIWMSMSSDYGKTWKKPRKMKFNNPDSAINGIRLKSGSIVLAFNDSKWYRTPLTVALTENDGRNWDFKKNLETEKAEYSYPFMIQSEDGLIHLTYTSENRKFINHVIFNEEWLKSE
ncbi:MAG TPA: exo-alpha-sialidase [bacterium]|nr:exo-alpha-sialidase [bacterium]